MGQAVDPDLARAILWNWSAANRAGRPARAYTISRCARALLGYHGFSADALFDDGAGRPESELRIDRIDPATDHLSPVLHLPMPFGDGRMTIVTGPRAHITMPGLAFSPAIGAAAIGRPLRRVTGHRAFDALPDLLIDDIRHDAHRGMTVIGFTDTAEPLRQPC